MLSMGADSELYLVLKRLGKYTTLDNLRLIHSFNDSFWTHTLVVFHAHLLSRL